MVGGKRFGAIFGKVGPGVDEAFLGASTCSLGLINTLPADRWESCLRLRCWLLSTSDH